MELQALYWFWQFIWERNSSSQPNYFGYLSFGECFRFTLRFAITSFKEMNLGNLLYIMSLWSLSATEFACWCIIFKIVLVSPSSLCYTPFGSKLCFWKLLKYAATRLVESKLISWAVGVSSDSPIASWPTHNAVLPWWIQG